MRNRCSGIGARPTDSWEASRAEWEPRRRFRSIRARERAAPGPGRARRPGVRPPAVAAFAARP